MSRLLALVAGLLLSFTVAAHSFNAGTLELGHPWSRAMPETSTTGAAYLSINNTGKEADTLLSASTPRADAAQLHQHVNDNGVMRMREVPSVVIPAGATVKFAPGGYHIMLIGLKQPLKAGDRFPLTLKFAKGGTVTVEIHVEQNTPAEH